MVELALAAAVLLGLYALWRRREPSVAVRYFPNPNPPLWLTALTFRGDLVRIRQCFPFGFLPPVREFRIQDAVDVRACTFDELLKARPALDAQVQGVIRRWFDNASKQLLRHCVLVSGVDTEGRRFHRDAMAFLGRHASSNARAFADIFEHQPTGVVREPQKRFQRRPRTLLFRIGRALAYLIGTAIWLVVWFWLFFWLRGLWPIT